MLAMVNVSTSESEEFNFDAHRRNAVEAFQPVRPLYEAFADVVAAIVREALKTSLIGVASIEKRAKTLDSFGTKASQPSESDPHQPKYNNPMSQITDLAGARIITFFPQTVDEVDKAIHLQFDVLEKINKADLLVEREKLGYQSVHYIVKLRSNRTELPEYARYSGLTAEIQVRTILQHAWAEIEHDIQYKSVETIPVPIKRRFMALAGLLEIADREFQAVQNEDQQLRQAARASVNEGRFEGVEITSDALKTYLNRKLGSDGRMSDWSYEFEARVLRRLGFTNFQQIDQCVRTYDDDQLSRALWGTRQGQLTRFEYMLLASMGEEFIEKHPLGHLDWWATYRNRDLAKLREAHIPIGNYVPVAVDAPVAETRLV